MGQFVNSSFPVGHRIRRSLPRVAITMGDPAGIGPEVVLKAVAEEDIRGICIPIIIGDAQLLAHTARTLDLQCGYDIIRQGEPIPDELGGPVIFHLDNIGGFVEPGIESGAAGKAAAGYIEAAVQLCAAGSVDAIATAPINKRALFLGGYSFPGHTEFLAHLTNSEEFAMAFVAANLRIVLLSTHVPLAEAIRLVERERIMRTINLTHRELKRWGIERPRIAVAALNPHGAEGGLFGMEEAVEIAPAVEACHGTDEINVQGPFSADTVFLRASRGEFDAVVACYHDQAMIPVKCLSFGEAVNVTLGLPFIRTSVDHGTAFDIAGKGLAEHSSMLAAIKLAADLSNRADERVVGPWKFKNQMANNEENTSTSGNKQSRRVLVADDDPAILRLVKTILEKENYQVVTARDGREAYKILQNDPDFTAGIFDVVMPHISGPELVRFMKTEKRLMKIPVMMMTAEQDPKLSSDSFAAGAVVFLPKPFTTAQLNIMLQMLVGKAGAR